jgi:hypothetical protein
MVLQAVYPDIRTAISNRITKFVGKPMSLMSEPLLSYQSHLRYGIPPERIAPIGGIGRFRGALLLIGGSNDLDTTVRDTQRLYAAAAARPKSLWLVAGANHVETSELWSEAYRQRIRCLFANELGEPLLRAKEEQLRCS